MPVALALAALVAVLALVAALSIARRASMLRRRAHALANDALEPKSALPPVALARARHLRTVVGRPPSDACLPELPSALEGELVVTEREIALANERLSMHVPLARVRDATFVSSFESARASDRSALLIVTWRRGGELLETALEIFGRRLDAERVRREIHLRAGEGKPPTFDGALDDERRSET